MVLHTYPVRLIEQNSELPQQVLSLCCSGSRFQLLRQSVELRDYVVKGRRRGFIHRWSTPHKTAPYSADGRYPTFPTTNVLGSGTFGDLLSCFLPRADQAETSQRLKGAWAFALLSLICLNDLLSKCSQLFGVFLFQGLPCECAPPFFGGKVLYHGAPAFPSKTNVAGGQSDSPSQLGSCRYASALFPWWVL